VRRIVALLSAIAVPGGTYVLVVRGALTLDLDLGRRIRPLGPIRRTIAGF